MEIPYIKGSANVRNNRRTKYWQHSEKPAIYLPYNLHLKEDMTEFYEKTPQEMSRKEIQELEKQVKDLEEVPTDEADAGQDEELNLNLLKNNKEFLKF